jgi:hypothetical protein
MRNRLQSIATARQIAAQLLALRGESSVPPPRALAKRRTVPIDYPRLQHHMRWFDGLLRLYRAVAQVVAAQLVVDARDDAAVTADPSEPLIDFVRRAHRILLEHPVAAKAAYAALAAQGRAYAATRDGGELRARLAGSRRLRRASLLWRSLTMGMLDDQDPGELPATYLDNLLRAVDRADLEQLLGKLSLREVAR